MNSDGAEYHGSDTRKSTRERCTRHPRGLRGRWDSTSSSKRVRSDTKRRASRRHRHWRLRTYLAERRRRANWTERRRLPLAAALRVRSGGGRFRRRRGRPPRRRRRRRRRRSQQPWRDAEAAGAPSSLPHSLRPRFLRRFISLQSPSCLPFIVLPDRPAKLSPTILSILRERPSGAFHLPGSSGDCKSRSRRSPGLSSRKLRRVARGREETVVSGFNSFTEFFEARETGLLMDRLVFIDENNLQGAYVANKYVGSELSINIVSLIT